MHLVTAMNVGSLRRASLGFIERFGKVSRYAVLDHKEVEHARRTRG